MKHLFQKKLPEDFNSSATLRFLARSDREVLHKVDNQRIKKWVSFGDENLYFELSAAGPQSWQVHSSATDPAAVRFISDYLDQWFDLRRPLSPFYDFARQDELLAPIVERHRGLRIIGIPDLFEALSWSVIGQQINLAFAYTLKRRMVENWGESFEAQGQRRYLFPRPEAIAPLEVAHFTPYQYSRRKAEYLIGIARLMADGQLSKAPLQAQPFEEALHTLVAIRGIGPWSAHYVLMKCLLHGEAYPAQDAGLHQALRKHLQLPTKPDKALLQALGNRWGPWRAYAVFYLWQSLL
ncbi:MAG: DNA-3-methyladenine glycosylase [Bacteroidota bacterium]